MQAHVIHIARSRDVYVIAPAGSGKTLCFLIPMIWGVFKRCKSGQWKSRDFDAKPCGLIVSPTRDLAKQVNELQARTPSRPTRPSLSPSPLPHAQTVLEDIPARVYSGSTRFRVIRFGWQ